MAERGAGRGYLAVNEQIHLVSGYWEYDIGGNNRHTVGGQDGVHGYSETLRVPYIQVWLDDTGDLTIKDLRGMGNATITIEFTDHRQSVTGREMWSVNVSAVANQVIVRAGKGRLTRSVAKADAVF
jgi:hypothetical protein